VIATQPAVVAGGITIWTRSPLGKLADSSGEHSSMRCCVEFATSLASRLHQSKSAKPSGSRRHPAAVSRNASPGSIDAQFHDSGSASSGRSARSVSASADGRRAD
jgi:hypothetical protein